MILWYMAQLDNQQLIIISYSYYNKPEVPISTPGSSYFSLMFIKNFKFLINTREKQEMPEFDNKR